MAEKKASPIKSKKPTQKAVVAKKPAAKKNAANKPVTKKALTKIPANKPVEEKVIKARKPRKTKLIVSSFEMMLQKQAELDKYKKQAMMELKKKYDEKVKEADEIKAQYRKLFGESIESAPKALKGRGRKASSPSRGYTLDQIESFLSQMDTGKIIKIEGKNATGIARIRAAYDKSPSKDPQSILDFINK